MAAYRRVDDLTVTCRLTACTPGPAPGPTLGIEYGKPLPLLFLPPCGSSKTSRPKHRGLALPLRVDATWALATHNVKMT